MYVADDVNDANGYQAERPRERHCTSAKTNVCKPIDTPLGNTALSLSSLHHPAVWQPVAFGWCVGGNA
jgi:hypothetical protein